MPRCSTPENMPNLGLSALILISRGVFSLFRFLSDYLKFGFFSVVSSSFVFLLVLSLCPQYVWHICYVCLLKFVCGQSSTGWQTIQLD
ncbi:hypothetical protein V1525DRAFT_414563 [Lipomyces kononenkoae]|uniref:Uncharacterized protein n=1 Tax=Lipomyces kononenkoae TaxID=34357 RepID=A0ACC3SQR9_LIPKO